ncbi:MAG: hypothetical protein QUS09_03490, partial [Methanotrichaceae archaeon]|nr:hypothetical protein [Methanotrichaceae archaeon]
TALQGAEREGSTMILALDCAIKTGWCLLKDGRVYESGVEDFTRRRGESNGAMFLRFRHWLNQLVDRDDVYLVAYEQSHHRGGAATEIGVGLTTRVQEICAQHQIEYVAVHTTTLKKHTTGKGNADKTLMKARAAEVLGRQPLDDNEADAVLLALYTFSEYGMR